MLNTLSIGDQAPNFCSKDQNGNDIKLEDYTGKKLAIFFYPRDLTPTCTTQACNVRDGYEVLKEEGIEILGVSNDPESKHQKFIGKHDLPYPLLADTDQTMLNQFGVWGPKKFMGRTFDGTHRTTFLINESGKIVDIINKVKAKIHTEQILDGFKS
ncbi:MAG: thioredoxin-dependent thiol peroxidase [Flavobacteriales bacterium]